MIFDLQTLMSDKQAIVATAPSTNVIDLGPVNVTLGRDIGKGKEIPLRMQVVETFNNLTSLAVALQVSDDAAFTSPVTVWTSTLLLAALVAGAVVIPEYVTRGTNKRFMRLNYTVVGTAPTLGRITAGVTMGNQSNG